MADVKITNYDPLTTPAAADLFEIVDDVAGTPTSKKITWADLFKAPTIITPDLGTPSAGDLANCTGLPGSGLASGFPVLYERSTQLARSAVDTVTVYEDTAVNVDGTIFIVAADTALELNTNATWDTGTALNDAARAGHDYYVYACDNSGTLVLLVSADGTNPTGYTTSTSRKIGGFHCLCVAVGTIGGHTLTDFAQGDVLPASVWDIKHRPVSSPEGMVFSEEADIWVDIYLASGTGGSTASVNGGTISDTRDWNDFVDDFGAVKKQLLDDAEFQLIAAGSNEETNITGNSDPVTTGGHSDSAGRRMISNIGCEDCAGAMYQWLRDQSAKYDDAVAADWYNLPGSKGSLYRPVDTNDVKLLAGGSWVAAALCGSRCRYANRYRWLTSTHFGGRGRSRKL
uniref:Major tropism determinant second domain-containing protein n=1 Tax=Candidatus Desulfatibia profunda TaxID=2841695 RepID=A0A8J6TIE7_9BACT|nr:hypothetical protein [Candidatus Desulfatibia profunda]